MAYCCKSGKIEVVGKYQFKKNVQDIEKELLSEE